MPGIARKIVVCAAIDGLIVQPVSSKGQRAYQPVRVKYDDSSVSAVPRDQVPDRTEPEESFEAFGIIGLITVSRLSYLITIVRRQQVAQIRGCPVFVVTDVAVTPCTSQSDANESIRQTAKLLQARFPDTRSEAAESSDGDSDASDRVPDDDADSETDAAKPEAERSSVAEDVIRRRGSYGRFAQSWFSNSGWTMDQRRSMGMSISSPVPAPDSEEAPAAQDVHVSSPVSALLPKLLRFVKVVFGSSRSFYFSYDVDVTRSLAQNALLFGRDAPLHAQVDVNFFWNRHILRPFVITGQDALALPVMQGFVGQRAFVVDTDPPQLDDTTAESLEMHNLPSSGEGRVSSELRASERRYLVTLISRRSTKRAGLRYLRRGVNEDGFTANMVETEQILSSASWDQSRPTSSFLQVRGSIPLYFTQSAYSLKPVPVIQHSVESNIKACGKHFQRLSKTYGLLQVVSLVEKTGIEEPIGSQYQESVDWINKWLEQPDRIPFEWFDFHQACRGMKFENVGQLLLRLKGRLEEHGTTTQRQGELKQKQKGVVRTNCMDCLDRTNVCQSSFAKYMLDHALKEDGVDMSAQLDQETAWFNTLWADNGDAVSKQYASTAAMKGDYTRTRKRDYRGALNDLGLSLARFYSGMVNDYFGQAAIDFLLGNVTSKIFDEFEADMMTKDPAVSISNMRQRAVELCRKRVVADEREEFHGGWVLLSPNAADVVKSWSMDEVVLLLTDAAVYLCRFDWDLDKVSSFERVHLANVTSIKQGTYITSTVSPAHTDEERNVGFVIEYQPGKSNIQRTNTRTLSSRSEFGPGKTDVQNCDGSYRQTGFGNLFSAKTKSRSARRLALKAPYANSSASAPESVPCQTEKQLVTAICAEIERLALERQFRKEGDGGKSIVEKGDVISLEAAKRNTGLLEQLGHSIKKLVWA